jgi:hypothetical protein
MPTHNDETLHDRYAREHADHMARLAKMTPEQIAEMELSLHNAMAELERLRDQQAKRIGELEELLLRVQVSLSLDDTEWGYSGAEKYKLLADIRAALSAGKEGE